VSKECSAGSACRECPGRWFNLRRKNSEEGVGFAISDSQKIGLGAEGPEMVTGKRSQEWERNFSNNRKIKHGKRPRPGDPEESKRLGDSLFYSGYRLASKKKERREGQRVNVCDYWHA